MTGDPFEEMFGQPGAKTRFQERVARGDVFGGRVDPRQAMAVEASTAEPQPGTYRAFGFMPTATVNQACEVRRWIDGTELPEGRVFFYRLLLGISFSGEDELRLMLPDAVIVLTGQHLDPLRQALTRGLATFIQQWNGKVWQSSPKQNEAVVNSIEVLSVQV